MFKIMSSATALLAACRFTGNWARARVENLPVRAKSGTTGSRPRVPAVMRLQDELIDAGRAAAR
jgi:hypothetical protein